MDSNFEVDRSRVDGHARVRFVGELDVAEVAPAWEEVLEVLEQTPGDLTIDLRDLTFCDSSGVRLLYRIDGEAKARGRRLVLQDPSPAVERVLRLLEIFDQLTIEDAS